MGKILRILLIAFVLTFTMKTDGLHAQHLKRLMDEERLQHLSVQEIHQRGYQHYLAREYDEAIDLFERAYTRLQFKRVVDDQFKADLLYHLSSAYMKRGHKSYFTYKDTKYYNTALNYAGQCLKVMPDYWQAYENIGIIYTKVRDYNKAKKYYARVLQILENDDLDYERIKKRYMQINKVLDLKKKKEETP